MEKNEQFPITLRKVIGIALLFGTVGMASCQAFFGI